VRQSNLYILLYSAGLTVVCGGLLAIAALGLKDRQEANIALERKGNILSTVIDLKKGDDISAHYESKVRGIVLDFNGNVVEGMKPEQVVIAAEYKKAPKDRLLPVYEFRSESNPDQVDFAVLPVYGYGLWNNIWGYVALRSDFNTVQGVRFEHAGETPGLGARINTDRELQERYKGKLLFETGKLVSVNMQKGEGVADYSGDPHKVDGMSGATLTGKGVNNMLKDYFACYESYLRKKQVPTPNQ
jgi:Na+-transporting NADH:ubiquinone oxidoreductase subunit C